VYNIVRARTPRREYSQRVLSSFIITHVFLVSRVALFEEILFFVREAESTRIERKWGRVWERVWEREREVIRVWNHKQARRISTTRNDNVLQHETVHRRCVLPRRFGVRRCYLQLQTTTANIACLDDGDDDVAVASGGGEQAPTKSATGHRSREQVVVVVNVFFFNVRY